MSMNISCGHKRYKEGNVLAVEGIGRPEIGYCNILRVEQ